MRKSFKFYVILNMENLKASSISEKKNESWRRRLGRLFKKTAVQVHNFIMSPNFPRLPIPLEGKVQQLQPCLLDSEFWPHLLSELKKRNLNLEVQFPIKVLDLTPVLGYILNQ